MEFNFLELLQNSSSALFWSYLILFTAMVAEGPIATMTGAFLSSLGGFNVFIIYFLSILGDVVGDIILYYIGYKGGRPVLAKAEKILKVRESLVQRITEKFDKSGEKIIFYVKISTGLCWITFLAAGVAKMNFKKFLKYSILGGFVWSGFLVLVGYFFGYAAGQIEQYIKYAGWVIFGITLFFIIAINVLKKKRAKKLFSNENNKEK